MVPAALRSLPSDIQLLYSDPVMLASNPVLLQWWVLMLGLAAAQCQGQFPHEFAVAAATLAVAFVADELLAEAVALFVVALCAVLVTVAVLSCNLYTNH